MNLLAPSLLSANFANLEQEIIRVAQAGADWIHVDVMDGHFVPNLTIGPPVVKALAPVCPIPLDCHLMVSQPENWIEPFAAAGASVITVHAEATHHLHRLVQRIRALGKQVGVSINPATPIACLEDILSEVDLVLVMSVNPGFGGQKFISSTLQKIKSLAQLRTEHHLDFKIEVDGGVDTSNITQLKNAGASIFVAGSAIFDAKDPKQTERNVKKMKALIT